MAVDVVQQKRDMYGHTVDTAMIMLGLYGVENEIVEKLKTKTENRALELEFDIN